MVRWAIALIGLALLGIRPAAADEDAIAAAVRAAAAAALAEIEVGAVAGIACAGDCNGDGRVSIEELVRAVAIALGLAPAGDCAGLDADRSGRVDVAELIAAVGRLLDGCGGGGGSVCGGPITSAPKLCDLAITPRRTTAFGTLRISFAISDLEGDVVTACAALAPQGSPRPELSCESLPPSDGTVNEVLELPPIQLMGARNGTYVLYLQVRDARGASSAIVSATFTVGVRV